MTPVVAAFDVDRTLTVRDCVLPFLVRCGGVRGAAASVFGSPLSLLRMILRRDRDGLKAHFVRAFLGGMQVADAERLGAEFAAVIAQGWMRPDVAARLRWHQDQGHVVLLVSASLSPYLEPLGEILEVDAVLCTRLASENGRLTGELEGRNCRGAEKAARLNEWSRTAGIEGDAWLTYSYGDSAGDAEMLAMSAEGLDVSRTEVPA